MKREIYVWDTRSRVAYDKLQAHRVAAADLIDLQSALAGVHEQIRGELGDAGPDRVLLSGGEAKLLCSCHANLTGDRDVVTVGDSVEGYLHAGIRFGR